MSEDVNFDYPMKKSCTNEITTLCKDVSPGTGQKCSCRGPLESNRRDCRHAM